MGTSSITSVGRHIDNIYVHRGRKVISGFPRSADVTGEQQRKISIRPSTPTLPRLYILQRGSRDGDRLSRPSSRLALMEFPPPSVLAHIIDVHCHPTDTDIPDGFPENLPITICAMSAQTRDQPLVRDLANRCPDKVVPAFGKPIRISVVISLENRLGYLWT